MLIELSPLRPGRAEWIASIGILVVAWAAMLWLVRDHWAPDMSAIYYAAWFFHQDRPDLVYASPPDFFNGKEVAEWAAARSAMGYPDGDVFPYVYPPLWARLLSPVTGVLDPMQFFRLTYAVQLGGLGAAIVLAWRLMGQPMRLPVWTLVSCVLIGSSFIGYLALLHDQPQITVAVLTLLAFERLRAGAPFAAGAALGLAAALKVAPILLLALFLLQRQWRATLVTLAVAGGLALVSLAVAGIDLHLVFLGQVRMISRQVVFAEVNFSPQTLLYLAVAALNDSPVIATARLTAFPRPEWLAPFNPLLLAGGVALILWHIRRWSAERQIEAGLPALLILMALASPLSWSHHFLAPLLCLPALAGGRSAPRGFLVFLAVAVALSSPLFLLLSAPVGSGAIRMLPAAWSIAVLVVCAVALLSRPPVRAGA